jgi:AmiR/NasT family two-component response regulator
MMQKLMTEDDAFKVLRKMAMDKGQSIAEVAASVMAVAELLS